MSWHPAIRKELYGVEEILSKIPMYRDPDDGVVKKLPVHVGRYYRVFVDGDWINLSTENLHLFDIKGTTCVKCGIHGVFFAKEKRLELVDDPNVDFHMSLYAFNKEGQEVLMTKDHIMPASCGGVSEMKNYQVMCEECNQEKSNKVDEELLIVDGVNNFEKRTFMEEKLMEAGLI